MTPDVVKYLKRFGVSLLVLWLLLSVTLWFYEQNSLAYLPFWLKAAALLLFAVSSVGGFMTFIVAVMLFFALSEALLK